jgi:hypothetical protein
MLREDLVDGNLDLLHVERNLSMMILLDGDACMYVERISGGW